MGTAERRNLILDNLDYLNSRINKFGYIIIADNFLNPFIKKLNLIDESVITLDNIKEFIDAIINNNNNL